MSMFGENCGELIYIVYVTIITFISNKKNIISPWFSYFQDWLSKHTMYEIILILLALTGCLLLGLFVYCLLGKVLGCLLGDDPDDTDIFVMFIDTWASFYDE